MLIQHVHHSYSQKILTSIQWMLKLSLTLSNVTISINKIYYVTRTKKKYVHKNIHQGRGGPPDAAAPPPASSPRRPAPDVSSLASRLARTRRRRGRCRGQLRPPTTSHWSHGGPGLQTGSCWVGLPNFFFFLSVLLFHFFKLFGTFQRHFQK